MSIESILQGLGSAYGKVNDFMVENPFAVAAARQGLNYAMAQGQGPRMNLPSAYHTKGDALTGRTRMQTANRGMRLMKKGGQVNYMGGGQMERGHNDPASSVIIKLAEQGMRMPRDKRAMLAEMLMRD